MLRRVSAAAATYSVRENFRRGPENVTVVATLQQSIGNRRPAEPGHRPPKPPREDSRRDDLIADPNPSQTRRAFPTTHEMRRGGLERRRLVQAEAVAATAAGTEATGAGVEDFQGRPGVRLFVHFHTVITDGKFRLVVMANSSTAVFARRRGSHRERWRLMADDPLQFNCPRCGRPMTHVWSSASQPGGKIDTFCYTCVMHGQLEILPNGRILPKPETLH
jgi:hypothetical protein